MYKRQVRLQKIFCLLAIIASALVFVYSLGLVTDLYDALQKAMFDPTDFTKSDITGAKIFYDIQPFNNHLMLAGLGLIILSLGLYITQTHARRRYYIGNFVATGIWAVAALGVAGWMHHWVAFYKHQFQTTVNFAELADYSAKFNTLLMTKDSTFWFDIHYAVMGVLVVMAVVLVANAVWKVSLMKQEAALLAGAPAPEKAKAQ